MTGNKLTWTDVRTIRERYTTDNVTTRTLGTTYGVTSITISKIIRNLIWYDPHYTPAPPKPRGQTGETNNRAKLDWNLVHHIRQQHATGTISGNALARQHGITSSTMSMILTNRTWHDPHYKPSKP